MKTHTSVIKKQKGIVYVALYVDDNLMIGDSKAINEAKTGLKNGLVLKIVEGVKNNFSCNVTFSGDKKQAWLGQPHQFKILKRCLVIGIQKMQGHKNTRYTKIFDCEAHDC